MRVVGHLLPFHLYGRGLMITKVAKIEVVQALGKSALGSPRTRDEHIVDSMMAVIHWASPSVPVSLVKMHCGWCTEMCALEKITEQSSVGRGLVVKLKNVDVVSFTSGGVGIKHDDEVVILDVLLCKFGNCSPPCLSRGCVSSTVRCMCR